MNRRIRDVQTMFQAMMKRKPTILWVGLEKGGGKRGIRGEARKWHMTYWSQTCRPLPSIAP